MEDAWVALEVVAFSFSGLSCLLIASSETPLSHILAFIRANFSRDGLVTNVSGTSTLMTSATADPNAEFWASTYSLVSYKLTAFQSSSLRLSNARPGRTVFASSSMTAGRDWWEAFNTVTSSTALFPTSNLSQRFLGNETEIIRVSPTLAPISPYTSPVI